jgi:hypothetical protein
MTAGLCVDAEKDVVVESVSWRAIGRQSPEMALMMRLFSVGQTVKP